MHIVMMGNLTEGFHPIGPFEDFDQAADWAGKFLEQSWVAEVESPKDYELIEQEKEARIHGQPKPLRTL